MKRSIGSVAAGFVLASLSGLPGWAVETTSPQTVIRQALHADLNGMSSQRKQILNLAAAQSDESVLVQSYLGKVRQGDAWMSLDEAAKQFTETAQLKAYAEQRAKTRDDFAGNVSLAEFCSARGLNDQSTAHLLRALDFEPDNEAVRRRLGHARSGSQWLTPEEIAEQQATVEEQTAANRKWSPVILKLVQKLASDSQGQRNQAIRELKKIDDPLAIPALEAAFANQGDAITLVLLDVLAGISEPQAAASLSRLAVLSASPVVRENAARLLGKRDRHSYVPQLLAEMRGPVRTRMTVAVEPDGRLLYRHEFLREGQEKNEVTVMDTRVRRLPRVGGSRRETLAEALRGARSTALQRELQAQAQTLNDQQLNDRIAAALTIATGERNGSTPEAWWNWWNQANEAFNEGSKPSQVSYRSQELSIADQASAAQLGSSGSGSQSPQMSPRVECFVAGTPVWTARGEESIEKLRVGDLVLAQDMQTGALEYKPIVRTTQRQAAKLVRVTIGNDVFDCTGGHLFWVVEQGWIKARDLKPGMLMHGAQGTALVTAKEEGIHAPTFNLVVADHHNYFVGETRCLTHDNTPRSATLLIAPGVKMEE